MRTVRLRITGRVQGVGYRHWTIRTARGLRLRGWVRNRLDGSVEALVAGPEEAVAALTDACHRGPPHARVHAVDVQPADAPTDVADLPADGFIQLPTA